MVNIPDVVLRCDARGCLKLPTLAPRIYVPPKPFHHLPGITLAFPHLSYCGEHWQSHMWLDDLLTDHVKARFEERGRKIWPQGVVCDFDAALVQPIDVFSPEFGQYMQRIGLNIDGLGYSFHNTVHRRSASG